MQVVRRVSVRRVSHQGGPAIARRAAEDSRYPIVFEMLEPRLMRSVDPGLSASSQADDGPAVDVGFADDGWAVVKAGGVDTAHAAVVQPDGKIVVAGWSAPYSPTDAMTYSNVSSIVLVRLNRDGTADTTFGDDGFARLSLNIQRNPGEPLPLVVQPDGKLLVGGEGLRRLTADGALDPTFGNAGVALAGGVVDDVALGTDGKVVVSDRLFHFQRFNPDGSIDTTFGNGGAASMFGTTPTGQRELADIFVLPDGRIVGTGYVRVSLQQHNFDVRQMLVRMNADGSPDASFGDGGFVYQRALVDGDYLYGETATMDAQGRILVGGFGRWGNILARYRDDGSLDPTFGDGGILTHSSTVRDVVVDANGRIIVTGSYGGVSVFTYDDSGTLLGSGVTPIVSEYTLAGSGQALALDAEGNVLVVAHVDIWNAHWDPESTEAIADFYVARVSPDADTIAPPIVLPQRDPVPPTDMGADPDPEPEPTTPVDQTPDETPSEEPSQEPSEPRPPSGGLGGGAANEPLFGGRDRSLFADFEREGGDEFNLIGDEEADEELLPEIL